MVTCEGETYPCLFILLPPQNPRSPRTSPLGLTSLKRKNHPIVVTLGGIGSCYASLAFYFIAFLPSYKLCDTGHFKSTFIWILVCENFLHKKQKFFLTFVCCAPFPASISLLVFPGSYQVQGLCCPLSVIQHLKNFSIDWVTKTHPFPSLSSISKVILLLLNPLWHNKGRLASTLCHCEWFVSCSSFQVILLYCCLHLG